MGKNNGRGGGRKRLPKGEKKVQVTANAYIPESVVEQVGLQKIKDAMKAAIAPENLNLGDIYAGKPNQ